MVRNYFATHLAPVWQALRDETQTALLAGLAGGIAILVILTLFPGDPFDYGAGDDGNAEGLKKYRDAYERARQRGEKPPPMPTPTELKKPEAKKEKDPPLVIDEERLAEEDSEKGDGITDIDGAIGVRITTNELFCDDDDDRRSFCFWLDRRSRSGCQHILHDRLTEGVDEIQVRSRSRKRSCIVDRCYRNRIIKCEILLQSEIEEASDGDTVIEDCGFKKVRARIVVQ